MNPWQARRRRRLLALWAPLVVITIGSIVTAQLLWRHIERTATAEERYERLRDDSEDAAAERLAWKMVQSDPSQTTWWIRFIDAHGDVLEDGERTPTISDAAIEKQLSAISNRQAAPVVALWYAERLGKKDADTVAVVKLAEERRPAPYANYVLGRIASKHKDWRTAAARYEREGLAFNDDADLWRALSTWEIHDAWNEVRKRIDDRRYAHAVNAWLRLRLAEHDRDWPRILLLTWPATYVDVKLWPVALALLAAALWFRIATRMGRIGDAVPGRTALYVTAFVLGVLSIYPTLLTVTVEEDFFGFHELGRPAPDLIFFVFGVGLREEAWKTILFLPLLPALLRRGSRIEAMTCGALVGLGFAAEENISYFVEAGESALPRFLTANFFHMSLTALVALATFDTLRRRATPRDAFNIVFPLAVVSHGVYDFLLETHDLPMASFGAAVVLIVLAQRFLRQLLIASSREEERGVLNLLVTSMALIVGVSYVYATTLSGPATAATVIAGGALSVAIVMYMFVRELGG